MYAGRPYAPILRNFAALRTSNTFVFFTGFVEPVIFLVAFGYGVGGLVGTIDVNGTSRSPMRPSSRPHCWPPAP